MILFSDSYCQWERNPKLEWDKSKTGAKGSKEYAQKIIFLTNMDVSDCFCKSFVNDRLRFRHMTRTGNICITI